MEKKHFFDKPQNVRRLLLVFYVSLAVLVIVDFFIPKHPHFPYEAYPLFYGIFGFAVCVGLVLVAKFILRPLVTRREDYYD